MICLCDESIASLKDYIKGALSGLEQVQNWVNSKDNGGQMDECQQMSAEKEFWKKIIDILRERGIFEPQLTQDGVEKDVHGVLNSAHNIDKTKPNLFGEALNEFKMSIENTVKV